MKVSKMEMPLCNGKEQSEVLHSLNLEGEQELQAVQGQKTGAADSNEDFGTPYRLTYL